jgi:hypothetical protein
MNSRLLVELIRSHLAAQLASVWEMQNDGRSAPSNVPLTVTVDHRQVSHIASNLAQVIVIAQSLADED